MQSNGIFMNKKGTGPDEMLLVSGRYVKALARMTAMSKGSDCEYSVMGGKFRMVKLAATAKEIYEELLKAQSKLPKNKGSEIEEAIATVIASLQAKYAAAGVGQANHRRGGGKTRRHRKSGTRRR